MKANRSIRFAELDLELAAKLQIDINETARVALGAEIARRLSPEYKKQAAQAKKEREKALAGGK